MHYPDRATVCVSTQAGCAMALRVLRHRPGRLRPPPRRPARSSSRSCAAAGAAPAGRTGGCRTSCSWAWASRWPTTTASGPPVERIHADLGLSARHLTISTVGIVPGIDRLAAADAARQPGRLAPRRQRRPARRAGARSTGATRSSTLMDGLRPLPRGQGPPAVSFEWALIDGVNDRAGRRRAAGRPLPVACRSPPHVNLIPLNPTPGLADEGHAAGRGAALPRPPRRPRRQRHDPPQPGHRHRRRLRPAGRRAGGDARSGPRRGYRTW